MNIVRRQVKIKEVFMVKKVICLGVMLIMIFSVGACGDKEDIVTYKVSVLVKAEFEEKFKAEEFTVEDFKWDNIEKIVYETWYDNIAEPTGWMTVYLKEHGEKQVLAAVKHFNTLGFVNIAETVPIIHID